MGNTLVALQILINVPVVSYKMLHYSLFPPLCKFCIRKGMWKIVENIKMKKNGRLRNVLSSVCTVKTLKWPTTSSNQSHRVSAEPSAQICETQSQLFPWFQNVNGSYPGKSWWYWETQTCKEMQLWPREHHHGYYYNPFPLGKKTKPKQNFVLCFTVAASKLTMQPKGNLSC